MTHITSNALTTIESLPEPLHDLGERFPFCLLGDHDQKVIGHGFVSVQRVSIESGECSILFRGRRINRKRVNLQPSELMQMLVIQEIRRRANNGELQPRLLEMPKQFNPLGLHA